MSPVGTPMQPQCANDYGIAHIQTKPLTMNYIWSESTQWLLSSGVRKTPWALITPMGMPDGQITMTLHIYRPSRIQWTWLGVKRSSGYWVTASATFGPNGRRAFHSLPFLLRKGRRTNISIDRWYKAVNPMAKMLYFIIRFRRRMR